MLESRCTRRQFTSGLAALAGASALPKAFAAGRIAASRGLGIQPFPMAAVRLLPGRFRDEAATNARYLDSLSTDRLLHCFRTTAGLTSTAAPFGGWELPTCELRGHFAGGHYLSAAAFAFAGTGNDELRRRGDAMVAGLAACQKANGNGYLSAYPQGLFEKLARGEGVWAPFYTLHKILAGLIDMYEHTGNEDALGIAEAISGWVRAYFSGIGMDQRQRMLRTEYGGMNQSLIDLYLLTGRERHLANARLFEQPTFLDPLAMRRDELQGIHANTSVPKVLGAARMYEATGETHYRDIAEYFLEEVLAARSYAIGNTSNDEHWGTPAGRLDGTLSLKNAECCVAYNLMKLERKVFNWTGDARWMDAYERSLFNSRLGTQNSDGLKQYFFPLAAGYWRAYGSPDESFWCCTGTGAEDFAKFGDTIYSRQGDSVYVNQFIASTLDWKEQGFALKQETRFPHEQRTTLTITAAQPVPRSLYLRVPGWIAGGGKLVLNGRDVEAFTEPGSYIALRRVWRAGDRVELSLPMKLWTEPLPGDVQTRAAMYGPLVLAADLGPGPKDGPAKIIHGRDTAPNGVPGPLPNPLAPAVAPDRTDAAPEWIAVTSAPELRFKSIGPEALDVHPMCDISDERYAVYWSAKSGA